MVVEGGVLHIYERDVTMLYEFLILLFIGKNIKSRLLFFQKR